MSLNPVVFTSHVNVAVSPGYIDTFPEISIATAKTQNKFYQTEQVTTQSALYVAI